MSTTSSQATRRLGRTAIASALVLAMAGAGTVLYSPSTSAQQSAPAAQQFSIPAGSLREALDALAAQGDVSLMYSPELVAGKSTKGLSGRYAPAEALRELLEGTGLAWDAVNGGTFVLKRTSTPLPAASAKPQARSRSVPEQEVTNMPTIFATAARSLNMDITRTEDDPQPYVVFDREQIERSGATSLEQFLQQRLTMNTSPANAGMGAAGNGIATSQITLRGLSAAQTLILVDGHRVSSPAFAGSSKGALSQADITGLPLGAIDRIEVLPTTASGIYGGSATGGVINIILRRDYTGGEVRFTYDNTFDTDTAGRKIDATFGHAFNDGKTNLMVTTNYSEANDLLLGDRDFAQRGREAIWRNNPGYFLGPMGQPPLGATPNIASADGSNLVLKPEFGGTALNASFTSVPQGYAGVGSDDGAALVANAGQYNWELANTAQQDSSSGGSRQALYTQPRVKSGAMVLRHQVNDSLQVFTDLSSSRSVSRFRTTSGVGSSYLIPASSPTNPFAQAIRVAVPLASEATEYATTIDHHRALAGLVWQLPRDWLLGADYTWDRTTVHNQSPDSAFAFTGAVTTGAIDVLRDTTVFPVDLTPYIGQGLFTSPFRSTMTDFNLRASGPIGQLAGGPLTLSASAAHRDENVADAFWFGPTTSTFYYPERSQTVTSTYLELRAPLFSERNARPGLRELELQLAVRRDDYTSRSGEQVILPASNSVPSPLPEAIRRRSTFVSTDPTVALRWKPWNSLALRASYGTGFVPPGLDQLVPTIRPGTFLIGTDPLRGGDPAGPFTLVTGGNTDLDPEQSKSWSAGLVLTPTALPNWRLSVDYTRIEKTDNIATHPGFFQGLINDEALFPGRIVRGPNLPGDPPGWAGPITQLDFSLLNLASATLEAWDVQLDYSKATERFGTFDLFFVGTWQPHFKVRTIESQPEVEHAGISSNNPLKFKANAGVTWARDAWRVGWNVQHFNGYLVYDLDLYINVQGHGGRVPSQTYHDVFVNYDFGLSKRNALPSWLTRIEAQFGIRNLFDKAPPIDVLNFTGLYSSFGDPRLSSYYATVTARF